MTMTMTTGALRRLQLPGTEANQAWSPLTVLPSVVTGPAQRDEGQYGTDNRPVGTAVVPDPREHDADQYRDEQVDQVPNEEAIRRGACRAQPCERRRVDRRCPAGCQRGDEQNQHRRNPKPQQDALFVLEETLRAAGGACLSAWITGTATAEACAPEARESVWF